MKSGHRGQQRRGQIDIHKMLLGEVAPDSGHFDIGETVKFGYYSQDGIQFNEQDKVIDAVRRIAEVVVIDEKRATPHRSFCNCFCSAPKPSRTTSTSSAEARSGGCILPPCSCAPQLPHPRRADQRPRHHDSRHLEDYITKFRGCVIIVSHDRFSSTAPSTICLCLKATAWSRISPATIPTTASGRRSRKRRGKAEERRAQSSTPTTHICQQDDIQGAQGV